MTSWRAPGPLRAPASVRSIRRAAGRARGWYHQGAAGNRAAAPVRSRRSQVLHLVWNRIKRRMAIHLVARRLEQGIRLSRVGRRNVARPHYPDADTLLAARVHIARMLDRHAGIGSVNAADVFVLEACAGADKDFEQRPIVTHNVFSLSGRLRRPSPLLFGVRGSCLPHPITVLVRLLTRFQPLAVAGAIALQHGMKLTPIDGAEAVVLTPLLLTQLRIGDRQPEKLGLGSG